MIPSAPKRWLPASAVKSNLARDTIKRCLAEWSDTWIAQGTVKLANEWRARAQNGKWAEIDQKKGISVRYRPAPDYHLAAMLLARQSGSMDVRTKLDKQLISRLTETSVSDLFDLLCKLFPTGSSETAGGNALELALLADDKTELIVVSFDQSVLVEHALKHAPAPRPFNTLDARANALNEQSIRLSAFVGGTKLELAELTEIGVGDVLVLDRLANSQLDLTIDNQIRGTECASLALDDNRLTLSIERTADQW